MDQNFDSYSVEYTFADGAKLIMNGRNMLGAAPVYASFAHGTKGMAIVSNQGDCGRPSSTYRTQNPASESLIWKSKDNRDGSVDDPFHNEWADLIEAIRDDKPFNEAASGVYASVVTSMGRYAAHTAQEVTLEEFLNHEHEYAPGADKFTFDSPAPVQADKNGLYPIPEPGIQEEPGILRGDDAVKVWVEPRKHSGVLAGYQPASPRRKAATIRWVCSKLETRQ